MKTREEIIREIGDRLWFLFIVWLITSCALAVTIYCLNRKFDSEDLPPIKNVIYTDQATRIVGDTLLLNTNK